MIKRKIHSGFLFALLATIVWSGNFIVARSLNATFTPITIAFFRWLIASVVILPIAYSYLRRDFKLIIAQWKLMLVLSFLGVTTFNTLIYVAAHSTTAFNLSLLAITAPIYVIILNRIIFNETLSNRQITGFLILIIGLLMLLSKGNLNTFLNLEFNGGDLLMAGAASIFALYSVMVKKKNPKIGNLSFVAATFVLGELMLLPFFIGEQLFFKPELHFTHENLMQLLYIGIGPSIISFYLWNRAILDIGSTMAATIYNTLPVFSALFAALMLNESILPVQIVSSIVIVGAVLMVLLGKATHQ